MCNDLFTHMMWLTESVVDFPRQKLAPEVWQANGDDYTLLPRVKNQILDLLRKFPGFSLVDVADEIRIVGSILSNQFSDEADIDVHIVPDMCKLPSDKPAEEYVADVFKFFRETEGLNRMVGTHPIEVYLQLDANQDLMSDGVYNLRTGEFEKGPRIEDLEFNPYEAFKHITDDISNVVEDADLLLADLKRDIVDYNIIKKAVQELPPEKQQQVKDMLQQKVDEMEDSVSKLMSIRKEWVDMRRTASKPATPEQALEDLELAQQWLDVNAQFKFLDRYQYLRLLKDLEGMMRDDGSLDSGEVELIGDLLGGSPMGKEAADVKADTAENV